nr:phosphatidylglycerophosphatase A [Aliikangiella sp. G2MR2-5]
MKISAKTVFTDPIHFLAFGFGSGLAPVAPGTFGTIAAIPLAYLIASLSLLSALLLVLVTVIAGIYICHQSSRKLNVHDHPGIVWDEFAGYMIAMLGFAPEWWNLLFAFIFFRIFDIFKPWPIKWVDKHVSGGLGIMLDDLIAGVFAWITLYGFNLLWVMKW